MQATQVLKGPVSERSVKEPCTTQKRPTDMLPMQGKTAKSLVLLLLSIHIGDGREKETERAKLRERQRQRELGGGVATAAVEYPHR